MNGNEKLMIIKILHTIIWMFIVAVIFYILYSGLANKINHLTWIAIGLVILEGLTLVVFKMFCPPTLIARKYSDSSEDNFDIYLPNCLAKYNKVIFTSIYLIGLLLVIYRIVG